MCDQFFADQEWAAGRSDMPSRAASQVDPSRRFPHTPALKTVGEERVPNLYNVGRHMGTISQVPAAEEGERSRPFSDEPSDGEHLGTMSPGGLLAADSGSRVGFRPPSTRRSSIIDFLSSEQERGAAASYYGSRDRGRDAGASTSLASGAVSETTGADDDYSPPQVSQALISMLSAEKLTKTNIKGEYMARLPLFITAFQSVKVWSLVTRLRKRPLRIVRSPTGEILDSPSRSWFTDAIRAWCILLAGIDSKSFASDISVHTANYDVCGLWTRLSDLHQKKDDNAQLDLYDRISAWNFVDPTLPYFCDVIGPWLVLISTFSRIADKMFPQDAMWLLFRKLCTRNPIDHPAYQRYSDEYVRHAESMWRVNSTDTLQLIEKFQDFDSVRPLYRGPALPIQVFASDGQDSHAALLSSTTTVPPADPQKAHLIRNGQCFAFAQTGHCARGDKCRYSHDVAGSVPDQKLTPQEVTILNRRASAGHDGGRRSRYPPHLITAGTFVAKEHRDVLASLNLPTEPDGAPGFWSKRQSDALLTIGAVSAALGQHGPASSAPVTPPNVFAATTGAYSDIVAAAVSPLHPQSRQAASSYLIPGPVSDRKQPAWGPPASSPWYAHLVAPSGHHANIVTLSSTVDTSPPDAVSCQS